MSSLERLLTRLSTDPRIRGGEFERICRWYLQNDPVYRPQIKRVWLWKDWPGRWGIDAGIDVVAELSDGSLLAAQAKAYDSAYSITKADVDTFLSESARPGFARRLIIATTNHIGSTALRTVHSQSVPAKFISLGDLERSNVDWPTSPGDLRPRRVPPKKLRPHQERAVDDICTGFAESDRGTLVMACGTGKTLVGLGVAERLRAKRVLVLLPSLTLLAQTLREWAANASAPFQALAVCSDATVYGPDEFVEHTSDLDLRVTTDPKAIRTFLRSLGTLVVFATYQSSAALATAAKTAGVPDFDLAIADEAHRCAGPLAGEFATILDARAVRARRRLFMTATPRYFTGRLKREAAASDYEIASMDDEEHFGRPFHELSFGLAIAKGLLADYRVVIVGINDQTYRDYAQRGVFVTTDGRKVTDARTLGAQLGLARAMKRYNLRRTISFHSRIASARSFSASLPEVIAWMPSRVRPTGTHWSRHISGAMSSGERDALLGRFRDLEPGERGLLANVRCLSEGVDIPSIDGIAFVDPRRSQIDIVQAVGRAIRNSPGKTTGTIVLPVFVDTTTRPEDVFDLTIFKPVWDVLRALRAHDRELSEQLDQLRRGLGRSSAGRLRLPAKIKLDLPISIDDRFADALQLRIVEQTTATWDFWYGLLQRFAQREHHALVPFAHTEDSYRLGYWVNSQRVAFGRGRLPRERVELLSAISGWTWDVSQAHLGNALTALERYVSRTRNAQVPQAHVEDGVRLGTWVNRWRREHVQRRLDSALKLRLEQLPGWTWNTDADAWDIGLAHLREFARTHGHTRVPGGFISADGHRLGNWTTNARQFHRRGQLSPERTRELESIDGWVWTLTLDDDAWREGLDHMRQYVQMTGSALVPMAYVAPDGYRLGQWVVVQRSFRKRHPENVTRWQLLESVPGWVWDVGEASWFRGLASLRTFANSVGHSRVPQTYVDETGFALGTWVNRVRSMHSKERLDAARARELENVSGWAWLTRNRKAP